MNGLMTPRERWLAGLPARDRDDKRMYADYRARKAALDCRAAGCAGVTPRPRSLRVPERSGSAP